MQSYVSTHLNLPKFMTNKNQQNWENWLLILRDLDKDCGEGMNRPHRISFFFLFHSPYCVLTRQKASVIYTDVVKSFVLNKTLIAHREHPVHRC